ncbi:MAG: 16S rRNA (cytosine(1402)-N(4))-methyltransferase RsmH [Cyanobacteria bacterium]|nr:16S rRNA (cytosine(1402)-N(4))-methyltransferase RsmH [Cyanobacteriota bacterium]
MITHIPVLASEIIEALAIEPGKIYVDGTTGGAGHSRMILAAKPKHLYSFDQDKEVVDRVEAERRRINCNEALPRRNESEDRWSLIHSNFKNIWSYCKTNKIKINGGILLDLGLSSIQLDDPHRGFSFKYDSDLDMRMDQGLEFSAKDIVNQYNEKDLADIIFRYGEERKSRQIAAAIIKYRPFDTSEKLAELIKIIYARGSNGKTFRIHPATKTFQALRIEVNKELEVLEEFLELDFDVLQPGAVLAIISFHSLEDRIVKNAFKKYVSEDKLELLCKKPIIATEEEISQNPRSRSAKLRLARVI